MVCLQPEELKKDSKMSQKIGVGFCRPLVVLSLLLLTLQAENLDTLMEGFDEAPKQVIQNTDNHDELMLGFEDEAEDPSPKPKLQKIQMVQKTPLEGFTGKITQQVAFSYQGEAPHDDFSSVKSSLLLDYEHKFENGFKVKTNAKGYYDAIYALRGRGDYRKDELDELESELELFDAYVEGSLSDSLDMKLGRQIVVWGRSDTIRITDVLNPLDNRRPGMVDIEDLRLPVGMLKFDYFVDDWRVTPMAIVEQRFSKNPVAGSAFNPNATETPQNKNYSDPTYALSIGGEFSTWDINFYAAQLRDDQGYRQGSLQQHDKVNMFGTALNVLNGSWLLKAEFAHFDGLKYQNANESFKRSDALVGLEYNGLADTTISYDTSLRTLHDFDVALKSSPYFLEEKSYQHAFRMSSEFMNATLQGNYLISLFGKQFDKGGFQRAWLKYDIMDAVYLNVGLVDYIGGSARFDTVSDNDMAFMDITYSF